MRIRTTLVALTAVLAACSDSATAPKPHLAASDALAAKVTLPKGRIFVTATFDDAANNDIYSMNADGTGVVRLTSEPTADVLPSVSQKGTLAFYGTRNGSTGVFVMNADGTNVKQVADALVAPFTGMGSEGFAISPDGTRLVFSGTDGSDREIYVMNVDGTGLQQLTFNNDDDKHPSFGPKGEWIAFSSDRDGDLEVYTMKADGTAVTRVTYSAGYDMRPAWSPDGRLLAFESSRDGAAAIFMAAPNGGGVTRVSPVGATAMMPTWAPGSKQLAYWNAMEIWTVNVDGSAPTHVSSGAHPAWGR
jgi:TolB protein